MHIVDVLYALGFTVDPASTQWLLELKEHERRERVLPEAEAASIYIDVSDLLKEASKTGLAICYLTRDSAEASRLVIETNSSVGFCSSTNQLDGRRVFTRVLPKVGTARMLELAALAEMLPKWSPDGTYVAPTLEASLLEWTIGAFARTLRQLLDRGGIRSTHERVRENLKNRLKGRLLVTPWLRNVSKGAFHVLPSEFPSLEIDNEHNQMLRWAIQVSSVISKDVLNHAHLSDELRRLDRHFTGVSLLRPRSMNIGLRVLPPNMRHYGEALTLARLVLQSARLGSSPGEIESISLMLDMNKVYELAFFNGLRDVVPSASRHEEWPIKLRTQEPQTTRFTRMIPDVWIEGAEHRLPVVIDTKWKRVLTRADNQGLDLITSAETNTVRLQPEDIYQAIAYATEVLHRRVERGEHAAGCVAALIYPALREVPDLGREIKVGSSLVTIRILGWNVSEPPLQEIRSMWERLKLTAEQIPEYQS